MPAHILLARSNCQGSSAGGSGGGGGGVTVTAAAAEMSPPIRQHTSLAGRVMAAENGHSLGKSAAKSGARRYAELNPAKVVSCWSLAQLDQALTVDGRIQFL